MNDIITGYEKALEVAYKALDGTFFYISQCFSPAELSTTTVSDLRDVSSVSSAILPVICAKQYGYEDVLARAIAEACLYTLPPAPATPKLDVDNIRTARLLGGSIAQTHMMPGMVLQNLPQNDVLHVQQAKVLVLTCGLEASSSETKGTVLLQSAQELLQFTRSEEAAFGDEIEQHFTKKVCPAGECKAYMTYHILPTKCVGCGECVDACEDEAILGKPRFIHVIDQKACTQCGKCVSACDEEAIIMAGADKPRTPPRPIPIRKR